jgi:hypothetical protein
MNPAEQERWKCAALDEIFVALAASRPLDDALVFKGARVLHVHLGAGRQSLDIDSNLLPTFAGRFPDREQQRTFLEREMAQAIRRHFERQDPVRYELTNLKVQSYPPRGHPMGWDAFVVRVNVQDLSKQVRSLPALEIDVAAPEELLDSSVSVIRVGGHEVHAYTLQRIAGEKMRAFLSSLPAYRTKAKKPGEAVRAKDLYDLARIRRAREVTDAAFWRAVGQEFLLACRSRYVDCAGLETFREQWPVTQQAYDEAAIPKDVPLAEAEATLEAVVALFIRDGIIPFAFPLPDKR